MHTDQIDIEPQLAAILIREQFPQFAGEQIVPLATAGTVNRIFRIGVRHAARFPLQASSSAVLTQEMAAMDELGAVSPVPTPIPIALGAAGGGYPFSWSIQTWLDGETATPVSHSRSPLFARDLANLVTALRQADTRDRPFDGHGRGGRLIDHDIWVAECLVNSKGLLDVPKLASMWAVFRTLPAPAKLVMSHRDLIPANLLVDGERLSGLLDGGGFGPADPALDLVAGWHLLDRAHRALFRRAIDVDEAEWRRGAAWAFEQAIGLVWYYRHSNPEMSALGESTLARILEEEADLT